MRNRRDNPADTSRARRLRRDMTYPERLLWSQLRSGQLAGLRFRRQEPLGPYIADFCCPAAKLVVELDGRSHDDPAGDDARDEAMQAMGWTVVRFSNDQVLRELNWVVERIGQAAGRDHG